jgi:uncharacterized protein YjbJ (UPF0337 family)
MHWETVERQWKQLKRSVHTKWNRLTEEDFDAISGQKDRLIGKIQERYGIAKEEAERQVNNWNRPAPIEEEKAVQRRKAS